VYSARLKPSIAKYIENISKDETKSSIQNVEKTINQEYSKMFIFIVCNNRFDIKMTIIEICNIIILIIIV
jgi:hypothetical protein